MFCLCFLGKTDGKFFDMCFPKKRENRACVCFQSNPQKNRKPVCVFYPKGTGGWKRVCVFLCFLKRQNFLRFLRPDKGAQ